MRCLQVYPPFYCLFMWPQGGLKAVSKRSQSIRDLQKQMIWQISRINLLSIYPARPPGLGRSRFIHVCRLYICFSTARPHSITFCAASGSVRDIFFENIWHNPFDSSILITHYLRSWREPGKKHSAEKTDCRKDRLQKKTDCRKDRLRKRQTAEKADKI